MPYHLSEDIFFKNFINAKHNATESTIKNYHKTLIKFHKATGATLETAVTKCKSQQEKIIEKTTYHGKDDEGNSIVEKTITKFNVNNIDSYIKLYFDTYINYCQSRGNKNTTINYELVMLKSFFNYYDVETPKISLEHDANKWNLLNKTDLNFIMKDSTLMHKTLISFLKSTGMRLSDALSLKVSDFMEGTTDYHNYVTVEEFVEKAPSDMIAKYEFLPQKTKRHNVKCITFNDPETSNLILQFLQKLQNDSLPLINKKYGTELKLTKDTPLFASKRFYFQKPVTPHSITNMFHNKNKNFKEYRINLIKEKIEKGELAAEDFEKEVEKIPRFHAHALRKFFETTIAHNCGDLRICAIMEGHTAPLSTDSHYIKIDSEQVKEAYMQAIPDLSLENTETKVYTSEIRREMEAKIQTLEKENEDLKQKYDEKEGQFDNMEERLSNVEKLFRNIDNMSDNEILNLFANRKQL